MTYVFLNHFEGWSGLLLSGGLLSLFAYEGYILMQFTKTGGLITACGILLVFYAMTGPRMRWLSAIIGTAITGWGFLYREEQPLLVTALFIGLNAVRRLSEPGEAQVPGVLALIAAVVSIAVKEGLFRYTRRVARKVSSPALMAGAWHHRSDALSSVGALIGIGGAMLGFPAADAAASLVICVFIGKAAFDISSEAVRGMVDRSADAETEEAIRRSVLNVPGVEGVDLLHTRSFGSRVYVEIEIRADGHLSLFEAHAIAEDVHNRVEAAFPQVKHIMVHVNPVGEP